MSATVNVAAYRTQAWQDTRPLSGGACAELPVRYGIQARIKGERRWRNMANGPKVVLFDTEAEAEAWIASHPLGETEGLAITVGRGP